MPGRSKPLFGRDGEGFATPEGRSRRFPVDWGFEPGPKTHKYDA